MWEMSQWRMYIFACFSLARHPNYLRAWNVQATRERALLPSQSPRGFTALARLGLFARPTKTTQANE